MIVAEEVTRVYRMGKVEVRALKGVSFTIADGEFVGITGASGSGKSTLLHILGLLDRPTSGRVLINGRNVQKLSDRQQTLFRLNRLGYVFQDYALIPELTAIENVIVTSLARGVSEKEYLKRGAEVLREVGLGDRINHRQSELSGGEQQRVAIARAIVNKPSILLADEPCANLDSETSKSILDLFKQLNEDLNQTIVMVSHEKWHERYFCRIIDLKDGLINSMRECDAGR
ncbi:ABC transporter ATP-binding protein [Methanoculleus sp. FWC-SCC1]|uniref:ABC transporter ATP-binding protein n=1 Tax=Methanoculleus frigidifontis TaxID=2584085 RepID=A0ABT8MAN2_9EURY|nr:ABC transporter ATP-binding protein [Methanoculleus sp. FWC-SCC1]MDN7024999.1 ABC transporter ATP-binding protein [Methanoculleus sp. FWC-SCC1]